MQFDKSKYMPHDASYNPQVNRYQHYSPSYSPSSITPISTTPKRTAV